MRASLDMASRLTYASTGLLFSGPITCAREICWIKSIVLTDGLQGRGVESAKCRGSRLFPSGLVDSGFCSLGQRAEAKRQQAPKELCGFFLTPLKDALLLPVFGRLRRGFGQHALDPCLGGLRRASEPVVDPSYGGNARLTLPTKLV